MTKRGWPFAFLGLVVFTVFVPIAVGGIPGIWRTPHALMKDNRVIRDRLHPRNNRDHEDYAFLNAVGAVWSADITMAAVGYSASTGFLIDRCHVLTNMHVVYTDDIVINPPVGKSVEFAVGQTEGEANRGALQGLRFLLSGVVVAHGDSIIVNGLVHNPENDWALIRLAANVDDSVRPLTIGTVDGAQLPKKLRLSIAGFPADLRLRHGDRFELKDLWESDGQVVAVVWASTASAVIESTIQATRGNSGGPLYGDFNEQKHIVIGMAQSISGNGIDVSESSPNTQVLFTPDTFARISAVQAQTPCVH
jgi:V8-like Glu-specific endopeptidase